MTDLARSNMKNLTTATKMRPSTALIVKFVGGRHDGQIVEIVVDLTDGSVVSAWITRVGR